MTDRFEGELQELTAVFQTVKAIVGVRGWLGNDLAARVHARLTLPMQLREVQRRVGTLNQLEVVCWYELYRNGRAYTMEWWVLKPDAQFTIVDGHRFQVKEN